MGASTNPYNIREIPLDDPDWALAVEMASSTGSAERNPIGLLDGNCLGSSRVRPVVGCFSPKGLCFAVAGVEAGRSNLLLIPFQNPNRESSVPVIRRALILSKSFGVVASQVIAATRPSIWDSLLCQSGFQAATELEYLIRPIHDTTLVAKRFKEESSANWISYSDATALIFVEALRKTYVGSLDCPEFQDMRNAEDSLDSHRAAGAFDPNHWQVMLCKGQPVAVLLLSRVRQDPWMEIVYMGVAQPYRRSGVADLLMQRSIGIADSCASGLILAVDVRNAPARRLYARYGFRSIARRSAWIAKLGANGS